MHPSNSSTAPPSHLCLPGNSMPAAAAAVGGAGDAPPPPLPTPLSSPPPPPTRTVRMRDSDLGGSGSKKGVREGGGLPLLPLLSSFDDDISEVTKNDDGNDVFLGLSQGKGTSSTDAYTDTIYYQDRKSVV